MNPSFLSPVILFISENFKERQQFLKSISFSRALRVSIAFTLPIFIGLQLGYFEFGLVLSFGAFWSSPSDVFGSFQHKKIGILISAILVTLVSFLRAIYILTYG